jgi:hypothetical protein
MADGYLLNVRVTIAINEVVDAVTGDVTVSRYVPWTYEPRAAIRNYQRPPLPLRIRLELIG